ncbi:hypothetical protein HAX54_042228 [Datura stramonium]|uniref:Uncharacterized protein n=1 Tax=Datura stramonium TaxID=4076 RepID=A0ABS8W2X0_DATST|nr:hypothetical protein [Datura stramonium]
MSYASYIGRVDGFMNVEDESVTHDVVGVIRLPPTDKREASVATNSMSFHPDRQEANQSSFGLRDGNQGWNYEHVALTQTLEYHDIPIRNLEERMNQLASQIKLGVNVDARGPFVEMAATNPECGKCYGDRITRNDKPPHVRVESVDGEDIDQDYGAMLFEESLEAVLLNHDGERIEGFKEVYHT